MAHSPPIPPSAAAVPPLRTIPGSYGWPVVGPIADRLNYFWFRGPEKFFRKRMEKYKSPVFRTNVPPTFPFFAGVNPNVVMVLDCKSYAHLFDTEIADKKDTLLGDFMPSVGFNGDLRMCAYQDVLEPKHAQIKKFIMAILKRGTKVWTTELKVNLDEMWTTLETDISSKGSATLFSPLQHCLLKLLLKSYVGADVSETAPDLAKSGPTIINTWFALQVRPTIAINVIQPLEEIFVHSFRYPSFLARPGYNKLANFIKTQGHDVVQLGVTEYGLTEEEAIHNLLFVLAFNSFEGFTLFIPKLLTRLLSDSTLQEKLRVEARQNGGTELTFTSFKQMPLIQSFVYETLRLEPPVPTQFARARKDFTLSSSEASYKVKKGELLCGYQPLVMRDPTIFDDPESFKPDRFLGEKGAELLNYLYWSNGPETGSASHSNKQCAGKEYVTVTGSLFVAHLLRRYDSISGEGSTIKAVEKAK
uniref:Cytochrome P450 CYP74B16 n=1 Tax=Linum usitatissimum TaxID=4006 RepID=E3VWA8_LINUS|nr:cytochrome P450 CYP74B16 [Linum usitatissimum]